MIRIALLGALALLVACSSQQPTDPVVDPDSQQEQSDPQDNPEPPDTDPLPDDDPEPPVDEPPVDPPDEEPEEPQDPVDPPDEEPDPEDPPVDEPPVDEPPVDDPPDEEPQEPPPCPDGAVCVDAFPFTHEATTTGLERSQFDSYGCAPDVNESGAEQLYRVEVAEAGFLSLDLVGMGQGADVDIHLLRSQDAGDCVDRGHWRAGSFVEPGLYWVVADTWVDGGGTPLAGDYTLRINLTTASDLEALGINEMLAYDAVYAFGVGWERGDTERFDYVITDFSMHSSLRRQWIVDLSSGDLLWNLHVAHGEASSSSDDVGESVVFSNIPESHQSSLGMLVTGVRYVGDFGISHELHGLEEGYNELVRRRDIVMHPSAGSRPEYVQQHGHALESWGCPAIDDRVAPDVVARMADGALSLFWYPDGDWSENSDYLPR